MALNDTIAVLARTPLIGELDRDALRLLAFSADPRRLRPGEVLFRQGDRSDGGYVVLEGELMATRQGMEDVAVAGPGHLVGQTALFARGQRPATVQARLASNLLRISPTLMRRILSEFPTAAAAMQTAVAADLESLMVGLNGVRESLLAVGARSC